MLAALLVGSLLNAAELATTAHTQPPGWQRDVAVALTDAAVAIASTSHIDRPAKWLAAARDAGSDDGAHRPATAARRPGAFVPSPQDPVRMLVAGDSLVGSFGPAMVETAAGTGVIEGGYEIRYSSGLATPLLFDWAAFLEGELSGQPAEVLVFMVGANDGRPIETAVGWAEFGSSEWSKEYRRRVAEVMDIAQRLAGSVYWIGQPIARDSRHSARVALMNEIYRDEATDRPRVHYVDSWGLFVDANGDFTSHLPDESGRDVLMREPDGVHLTVAGAQRLAHHLLDAVAGEWAIAAP